MIVISGSIPIDGSKAVEIAAAVQVMRDATLAEDGCVAYRFAFATDDPNVLLVVEEWRDNDVLGVHMKSAHMAAFGVAAGPYMTGKPALTVYEATSKKLM